MNKRQIYAVIVLITLGFMALLKMGSFWKWLLMEFIDKENELELVAGIMARLPILLVLIYLLKRFDLSKFTGIRHLNHIENMQAVIIPVVFIGAAFISNLNTYVSAGGYLLSIFIINNLLVALIEEFTFRGLIMPLILKLRRRKKHRFFVSVLLTAVFFGVLHYVNLFREPDNFVGITSQVVFAVSIGVFLGGLMLRTRHILLSVILHFLINFSFGSGDLIQTSSSAISQEAVEYSFDSDSLVTLLFFLFIAFGGWYMIKRADKDYFSKELDSHSDDLKAE